MSTQHPDNVTVPHFAEKPIMDGDDEVKEAHYAFTLGIDEQLWDAEGKEVDNFVVKKLLTRYEDYFHNHILGKDKFLTLRVPNPDIEKHEGKILLEALHSIPRNFDIATAFYAHDIPPVFEVVMPMCDSEKQIIRVHEYYKRFIIKNQEKKIYNNDITLAHWLGPMNPKDIRVTPLFETKEAILHADASVQKYLRYEKIKNQQRVWFARSDPALQYGSLAAVLLIKIGLTKLHSLQEKTSIDILPILGCGSAPFRGNCTPHNASNLLAGYPSMHTFTVQSAFKYDFPMPEVRNAVKTFNTARRKEPLPIDIPAALKIINNAEREYQKALPIIAGKVNLLTSHIPERRKRKLHIGLFGYARQHQSTPLPRAIKFCASLYSLGLPPELLGLSAVSEKDLEKIRDWYKNIDTDMADALQYLNKDNLHLFPELKQKILHGTSLFEYETNQEHKEATTKIVEALRQKNITALQGHIVEAGKIRKFLG